MKKLRYFAQFKCYHKKLKNYKTKKFNLNRTIFHLKTICARSRCNNIVVNYEYNIQKNKENKNVIFGKNVIFRKITKTRSINKENQNHIKRYEYLEK